MYQLFKHKTLYKLVYKVRECKVFDLRDVNWDYTIIIQFTVNIT